MPNSFKALATLQAGGQTFQYYRLDSLREHGLDVSRLPFTLKRAASPSKALGRPQPTATTLLSLVVPILG